ncbi:MAG: aminotransferase class IV [Pseudomonadota bacterium]
MSYSAHSHEIDARNASILIDINGELIPRDAAKVSVFDSAFMLGDGIWEGLRVHHGHIAFLDRHLDRLWHAAKALDFDLGVTRAELTERLYRTLAANDMRDGVHVRLMVSRGVKSTPYQDPRVTIGPPTIVIIAEFKESTSAADERGLALFTVHVRRGYADVQDPTLNTHSKHNCIAACIQAAKAGADEALMLDPHGFVATCNSTHFFIVRGSEVWTSTGNYCLDGITRRVVIELCERHARIVRQRNFTLADVYSADEAFVTGTFAGLTPVTSVDGRTIGNGARPVMAELRAHYAALIDAECGGGSS